MCIYINTADTQKTDRQTNKQTDRQTNKVIAITLLCKINDVAHYYKYAGSPLFSCSLDAQKCFDSIWHAGLFYKLLDHLPIQHWRILYNWYSQLMVQIKWKGSLSVFFNVTRGTRQGSLISPMIFNLFINALLKELPQLPHCAWIGDKHVNSFAYADDITLLSGTVPGLQTLIDCCANYASRWRFRFGVNKTNWSIGTP